MTAVDLNAAVRRHVLARLHEWHGIDPTLINCDQPLAELGFTSRDSVALAAELSELAGVKLPTTVLWEAPTVDRLARRVAGEAAVAQEQAAATKEAADAPLTVPTVDGAIAVVGIGCRLPGSVSSPADFWRLLSDGADGVGTMPPDRWEGFVAIDDPHVLEVGLHGGFLDDIAGFDAEFFGIPPSEAAVMDPQQRMLLEVAHEALDHAAICAGGLAGSRTGVFVGISGNEYARLTTADLSRIDAWTPPGAALSIAANRLSYTLDLRGPSVALDTACSSSLVAVHHAARSLSTGECDLALAGGVNALLSPVITLAFQRAGALAPDGRCKAFDAAANGMVRSEGCSVLVLRRLADAERSGDRVLAVIRGSAVNSDGRSNGLLAPNAEAQRALLQHVYAVGGPVAPEQLDYVEAHGTGTALGDPVEAGALGSVLGVGRDPDQPLLIGSVKTNLGHLEAAAGITSLAKTVLALHHGTVPKQLHFTEPSPHIDFQANTLRVVTEAEPWPRYSGVASAGVSAFGFGGTNAHVLVQEYRPTVKPAEPPAGESVDCAAVFAIDGPSIERLREDAAGLASWLRSESGARARPIDVAHTLLGRLGNRQCRAAVVARTREEAAEAFTHLAEGKPHPATTLGVGRTGVGVAGGAGASTGAGAADAVWVFSGYGSQWPGMAKGLLEAEPVFAAAIERLEPLILRHGKLSLRAHLESGATLTAASVVQPVLFGIQIALADLWRAYGLRPAAVIGHSMGEVAAAVVAGAIDEEAGVRIIVERSRLLEGLSGGAMAVVDLTSEQVEQHARELTTLSVAVHSSPQQCVVAGAPDDVERLVDLVSSKGGHARTMPVAASGHTLHVDPLLEPLSARLGTIKARPPHCRLYSTSQQDPRLESAFETGYWLRNLREPVRFQQAVSAAIEDGLRTFVEVSPHPTQLHPITETLRAAGAQDAVVLASLRRDTDEPVAIRLTAATLLLRGTLNVGKARGALHPGARIVDVPSARWRHQRHWADSHALPVVDAVGAVDASPSGATEPGRSARDRLRDFVAQVMGYSPQSIGDDTPLTELGLDSLHAMRILSMVESEYAVKIPPAALLQRGTIAQLAELIPETNVTHGGGVLPRDATERLVAQACQQVFGTLVSDVTEQLGALAEDPERAAKLTRLLGERVGAPVPELAQIEGTSTVASIADLLRPLLEAPVDGPVRVLRSTGTRPPLFLIHPAGGSSAVYRALVDRLDSDQPCYGLERLPGTEDVPSRAAQYARLIRNRCPDGPWTVGGWSFGGVVGQETARLLSEHGTVSALILIDSVLPLPDPGLDPQKLVRSRFEGFAEYVGIAYGSPLILPYEELAELDDEAQIETVLEILRKSVDLPEAALAHQRDSYLDMRSGERHTPRRYAGRTVLYRATEPAPHTVRDVRYEREDEALGWDELCEDLTVHPLPGHHLCLLDPPVVDVLARLLDADLRS